MTRRHLEVNLLRGLLALARAGARGVVVGPPGRDSEAAVQALLRDEALRYLRLELDVGARRQQSLEHALAARGDEPGADFLDAALRRQRASQELLQAALGRVDDDLREAMQRFTVQPRAVLETSGTDGGLLVELLDDGWSMAGDDAACLAARREFLGLPAGRDWLEREGA